MEMSAINLRSDLKKLSDAELADRLESALLSLPENKRSLFGAGPLFGSRTPVRHPRIYRFMEGLGASNSGNIFVDLLIPLAWSMMNVKTDHQLVCEIRDLMDEAERRVALRKRTAKA